MNISKFITYSAGLLMLCASQAFAITQLKATVDRNPVMVNESFVLQVVADESFDRTDLDLSPIMRSGFTVGRTSTSSQTRIVNGNISKTTTWTTVLLARQAGNYVIPQLQIDGVQTQSIKVEVVEASNNDGNSPQPIFLKNTIEQSQLFLQQTVKMVTKLYFAPDVDLQSGTLSDPVLEAAVIKQQGKDKESYEIIMGKRYRVIERVYTLTPQVSGSYTVTSPTFNGEISTDRRRSAFSAFGSRKPVSSIGNDLAISVEPIPSQYQGSWLPSDLVQINDELQPNQISYQVGEPITRTFTITALNVNQEQLPELKGQYPSSFNVYPDKSESHSVLRQNAIVAQRVSSEALVATRAGTYTFPEVSINWFNTKTRRIETATIPAKTIEVTAPENEADTSLVTNVPLAQQDISAAACPQVPEQTQQCPALPEQLTNHWLLIAISGWVLWLLTSLLWFFNRAKTSRAPRATHDSQEPDSYDKAELKRACKEGDATAVRTQLILWGQTNFAQSIATLTQLMPYVAEDLKVQVDKLNQAQYSSDRTPWSGDGVWQAVQAHKFNRQKVKTKGLPDLN